MTPLRMPQLNQITVAGRLTGDCEVNHTEGGSARGYFRLAVNRSYRRNEEWVEETSFFSVITWGAAAERAGKLTKGDPVVVEGRLSSYDPPAKDDGTRAPSKIEINAHRVQLVTYEPDEARGGGNRSSDDSPF